MLSPSSTLTIGRLARAAGVGIETIRYYQQRQLLPIPSARGAFRQYPVALVDRIRFVKRAQELGFSLDEIAGLLRLHDGSDRVSIRNIANARLTEIQLKLMDLRRMERVLQHLIVKCEHTAAKLPCPIIETLAHATKASADRPSGNVHGRRASRSAVSGQPAHKAKARSDHI